MTPRRAKTKPFKRTLWACVGPFIGSKGFLVYDDEEQADHYAKISRRMGNRCRAVRVTVQEIKERRRGKKK